MSAPDFAAGAYSALQTPRLDFRGPTFKEREEKKERKGGKRTDGKRREGNGKNERRGTWGSNGREGREGATIPALISSHFKL